MIILLMQSLILKHDNLIMQQCSIGVIVSERFCFSKCVCLLFTSMSCMENKFLPYRQGEHTETQPISRGYTCVEDASSGKPKNASSKEKNKAEHSNKVTITVFSLYPLDWLEISQTASNI